MESGKDGSGRRMTREEAIKVLEMFLHKQCDLERTKFAYDQLTVWDAVNMASEALAQPERKKGEWVNNIHDIPICDQCGYMTPFDRAVDDYEYGNYCPNCGADMREPEDIPMEYFENGGI